jgi:hypothetical protein
VPRGPNLENGDSLPTGFDLKSYLVASFGGYPLCTEASHSGDGDLGQYGHVATLMSGG